MASAAVKARLKALRRKYGLGEFKRSGSSRKRRRGRSVSVARRTRKRRGRRSGSGSGMNITSLAMSAGYGYFRRDIVSAATPIIAFVPAGQYSDNVALGLGAYIVHRYVGGGPMVKQAMTAIAQAEAFKAGEKARG